MSTPTATREGAITISGVVLRVYQLDDGRSVIHADDMHALVAAWKSGAAPPPTRAEVDAIARYLRRGPDA